ncbi:ATP-binding protein [Chitinispirillales bacterium ANBcel5]|uniref:HAMP domain-containing sensor histidine kinase n=1 Tax=Cellulosispirillum alkaliphilum TaxID=3039283 RepID=UPI002A5648CB|nr:ATP-binding protein [Chitinispirillales bacterium ANBcel5]
MRLKPIFWQLFPSYSLLTIVALVIIVIFITSVIERFHFQQTETKITERISLVQDNFKKAIKENNYSLADSLAKRYGESARMRFSVILPDGTVIADTDKKPQVMDNHLNRPEILQALAGETGTTSRYSISVNRDMQYSAKALHDENGKLIGFIRASVSIDFIRKSLSRVNEKIALMLLLLILVTALVSLALSRYLSNRIKHLQTGAQFFAKGNLDHKLSGSGALEFEMLARSMNHMAMQLKERLETISTQRNEQETILNSMREGVLAIGLDQKIIKINKPAETIIGLDIEAARGKFVQESIRNSELHKLIKNLLSTLKPTEEELRLLQPDGTECVLQVHGTLLLNSSNSPCGILVVLNDITRLKKLEQMRKDLVANVSHELRTPLTSIKGFVETILAGAKNNPHDTERFLNIISRHVSRLDSIIGDLLDLSKLEKDIEMEDINLKVLPLEPVCIQAVDVCQSKASAKDIKINMLGSHNIKANIDPFMLEQALVNLIDNAIKYSDDNTTVDISISSDVNKAIISVQDQGYGIEKLHLPRIFERFYRVDKARSRKLGGTGLGLSIVRHIVLAHKGTISVKSDYGRGTCFTIILPC